jgi:Ubiquinol-cytochrome C reductase complex 14kD subunit
MYLFRADDLIPEESEVVQLAIKRLPPKESYDRMFRLRRAFQVCQHAIFLLNNSLT